MIDKVTIVIPNYNGAKYLDNCMKALGKQTYPAPVIIVDNGSTDEGLHALRKSMDEDPKAYPKTRIRELKDNTGFANAVNVGIGMADTEYVLLLNNDTVPDVHMTERLLHAIDKRKRVFSVGAKLLSMSQPDVIDDCGDLYCALGWAFSPGRDKKSDCYQKTAAVTSACAGAAIYRKSVFDRIGMFDEAHFCYLEDVDVGLRARICGYKNLAEPSAVVYHAGSASSGSRYNAFKEELTAANSIYLIYKNMPALQLILNLPLIIAGIAIKQVYFARKGLGSSYAGGIVAGFKKCAANSDKKFPFKASNLANYCVLELELLVNCIRRVTG